MLPHTDIRRGEGKEKTNECAISQSKEGFERKVEKCNFYSRRPRIQLKIHGVMTKKETKGTEEGKSRFILALFTYFFPPLYIQLSVLQHLCSKKVEKHLDFTGLPSIYHLCPKLNQLFCRDT